MAKDSLPKRGDIWLVNLDPTVGSEITKTRPCAVIGVDLYIRNRMNIIVPITDWKPKHSECIWMSKIAADDISRLKKISATDASQVKSLSTKRFVHRIGELSVSQLENTVAAVVLCIGFEP